MIAGRPTSVYVIEAQNGLIKIGVSTNPLSRIQTVHAHSPVPCRLIAAWPGTMKDEHALHRAFSEFRGHCEWFRIEGPVAAFVEAVRWRGVPAADWPEHASLTFAERRLLGARKRSETARIRRADPVWQRKRFAERHARKMWRLTYRPGLAPVEFQAIWSRFVEEGQALFDQRLSQQEAA